MSFYLGKSTLSSTVSNAADSVFFMNGFKKTAIMDLGLSEHPDTLSKVM